MLDMGSDLLVLIIISGISVLIGMILGVLIANGLGIWDQRRVHNQSQDDMIRIWQVKSSNQLNLEIDGELYTDIDQLSVGQYKQVLKLLENLYPWMSLDQRSLLADLQTSEVASMTDQGSKPEANILKAKDTDISHMESVPQPPLTSPDSSTKTTYRVGPVEATEPPKSPGLLSTFRRVLRKNKSDEIESIKSLAEQINEILQEKVSFTQMKDLHIQLIDSPGEEIIFKVGDAEYTGIDDVPDENIKELIRSCVQEWERRQDEKSKRY